MFGCFVVGCSSGYSGNEEKRHFFKPPKKNLFVWRRVIPRADKQLQLTHSICDKHFEDNDIIKQREFAGKNGPVIFPFVRWKLVDGVGNYRPTRRVTSSGRTTNLPERYRNGVT
jgi:THAP domain